MIDKQTIIKIKSPLGLTKKSFFKNIETFFQNQTADALKISLNN